MIHNDVIYELDIDLDIKQLTDLALNTEPIAGFSHHHRLAENNSYASSIKDKYPFLSPVFNVYKFPPGKSLPIHIDADRFCAINIPICHTEDSTTFFYNKDANALLEYDQQRIVNNVKSPVNEFFSFTLTHPTLINTTYPHSVINSGPNTRIIISWSILKPMTFEECSLCL